MEWAELVLGYVNALAWPAAVTGLVLVFRRQIADKIGDLREAKTAVATASFFDRTARELVGQVEAAVGHQVEAAIGEQVEEADGQQDETADDGGRADRSSSNGEGVGRKPAEPLLGFALARAFTQLHEPFEFAAARRLVATSPAAAVSLAYTQMEKITRAAWTLTVMTVPPASLPVPTMIRHLDGEKVAAHEFWVLFHDLAGLRAELAAVGPDADVSSVGALDFITACESLSEALAAKAIARVRHPAWSGLVADFPELQLVLGQAP